MRRSMFLVGAVVVLALTACVPAPPLTVASSRGGLTFPWDVRWTPANSDSPLAMLYTERPYGMTIVDALGGPLLHWQPADLLVESESGMMSIELAPDFTTSRRVFACFASTAGPALKSAGFVLLVTLNVSV